MRGQALPIVQGVRPGLRQRGQALPIVQGVRPG